MPTPPEYAARRREVIRTHHPDVGGDPERLRRELARLDREFGRIPEPEPGSRAAPAADARVTVRPTHPVRRLRRRTSSRIRAIRARLPRSVPGSRRYFDI